MKSSREWYNEAESFIENFNGIPTLNDVWYEVDEIGIGQKALEYADVKNSNEYAMKLYLYIRDILDKRCKE